ncbi:MAG TPA: hypothetical protein VFN75_11155 [Pseudonocardiaceae bacterium]|nr:hypothetical protein [Pseudonocardiaceae bacterium]
MSKKKNRRPLAPHYRAAIIGAIVSATVRAAIAGIVWMVGHH